MQTHISLLLAAFLGVTAVGLGAFGAHALKDELLARATVQVWETAVQYHLIHAATCLAMALASPSLGANAWFRRSISYWAAGIFLFSGSLYWLALGGPRWIGPITPIGGILLILGWIAVALGARGMKTRQR